MIRIPTLLALICLMTSCVRPDKDQLADIKFAVNVLSSGEGSLIGKPAFIGTDEWEGRLMSVEFAARMPCLVTFQIKIHDKDEIEMMRFRFDHPDLFFSNDFWGYDTAPYLTIGIVGKPLKTLTIEQMAAETPSAAKQALELIHVSCHLDSSA